MDYFTTFIDKNIFWHINTFLGNDSEISSYTTAVARQWLSSDYMGIPTDTNVTIELQ
jgi:hypothetical protein